MRIKGEPYFAIMAIKIDLTPLLPLDPLTEPSSISQNWKSWKVGLKTYLVALNTTEDMQKRELPLKTSAKVCPLRRSPHAKQTVDKSQSFRSN